jgi:toxin ParE1/3/4
MDNYKVNVEAKEDLRRIYNYGVLKFGIKQADKYFNTFFEHFEKIAQNPLSFQSVDFIRKGYRRCPCGSDSIYYKIENGVIEIMAIIGSQDFDSKSI